MPRTVWLAAFACLALSACHKSSSSSTANNSPTKDKPVSNGVLDKLGIQDVVVGKGKAAQKGDSLAVEYTGKLADGTVFDTTNRPRKGPFTFVLGQGSVIKGWEQGLVGMKEGGERKLSIPPSLGYGDKNMGSIPPGSDLYFDVKLDKILMKSDPDTIIRDIVKVGTGPGLKDGDTAVVSYTATFFNGRPLDSKDKLTFKVGNHEVIPGVDAGIVGMKKGGETILQIPAQYGPDSLHMKASNETIYDIKLLDIKH
jgi:peptidylprolyl isomerase